MKPSTSTKFIGSALLAICLAPRIEASTATITPTTTYQRIRGFGTCSAWTPAMNATEAQELWDTVQGAGLSLHRVQIQANATIASAELTDMQWCKQYGVTVWGTPWYTLGGVAVTGKGYDTLYQSNYQAWADTLAGMANALKRAGTPIYAISSQNEPDIGWTAYSASALATWVGQYLGPTIANKAPGVKVIGTETCNWYGFSNYESTFQGNTAAWSNSSILATHEYGGNASAYPAIQAAGKEFWETEVYDPNTSVEDTGMGSALRVVALIHTALTVANMNAWHYWWITPCSGCANGALWAQSTNRPTKRLWIMGNYSRFVRPGFVRIGATDAPTAGVTVSAYRDSALTKIVVVAINTNTSSTSQMFSLAGTTPIKVTPWVTDPTRNIVADPSQTLTSSSFTYSLPATSVTTLVFNLRTSTGLARAAVQQMMGGFRWSAGVLTAPGMGNEGVQIIDARGRSRSFDLANGQVRTGQLPDGLYQVRIPGETNVAPQHLLVVH